MHDHQRFPRVCISAAAGCACCGRTVQADECGLPINPEYPFYNQWICDDCLDQIAAQSEEDMNDDRK